MIALVTVNMDVPGVCDALDDCGVILLMSRTMFYNLVYV
jgi:hypothetical protein